MSGLDDLNRWADEVLDAEALAKEHLSEEELHRRNVWHHVADYAYQIDLASDLAGRGVSVEEHNAFLREEGLSDEIIAMIRAVEQAAPRGDSERAAISRDEAGLRVSVGGREPVLIPWRGEA